MIEFGLIIKQRNMKEMQSNYSRLIKSNYSNFSIFYRGSLDSIRWDNDFIFPIILGAAVSLGFFEKPTITWEEYWKKNS